MGSVAVRTDRILACQRRRATWEGSAQEGFALPVISLALTSCTAGPDGNVCFVEDWSGNSLHVRIRVNQGTFHGIVEPYVDTTGAYVFGGTSMNFAPGSGWQEFQVDLTNPMTRDHGYDPAQVVLFGVHLNTGAAGANSTPVVFNIDSFYISP